MRLDESYKLLGVPIAFDGNSLDQVKMMEQNVNHIINVFQKVTLSHDDTFLGYNIYFEEIHQDGLVIQTTKFKWNYAFKKWEKILVLTHEYQFRQTDLERAVKIIKSQGWDTNLINEMLEKYKK